MRKKRVDKMPAIAKATKAYAVIHQQQQYSNTSPAFVLFRSNNFRDLITAVWIGGKSRCNFISWHKRIVRSSNYVCTRWIPIICWCFPLDFLVAHLQRNLSVFVIYIAICTGLCIVFCYIFLNLVQMGKLKFYGYGVNNKLLSISNASNISVCAPISI